VAYPDLTVALSETHYGYTLGCAYRVVGLTPQGVTASLPDHSAAFRFAYRILVEHDPFGLFCTTRVVGYDAGWTLALNFGTVNFEIHSGATHAFLSVE